MKLQIALIGSAAFICGAIVWNDHGSIFGSIGAALGGGFAMWMIYQLVQWYRKLAAKEQSELEAAEKKGLPRN